MADEVWQGIIEQVQAISGDIFATLNPPATEEEIESLEARVGVELPQSFKDYLATVNGQNEMGAEYPLVGYRRLYGAEQIVEQMDLLESLFDATEVAAGEENKIRQMLWSLKWIPFASFEGYDALILDLDPPGNGVYGQVWSLAPGSDRESDDAVVADSFEAFSGGLLERLQEKRYKLANGVIVFEEYWAA